MVGTEGIVHSSSLHDNAAILSYYLPSTIPSKILLYLACVVNYVARQSNLQFILVVLLGLLFMHVHIHPRQVLRAFLTISAIRTVLRVRELQAQADDLVSEFRRLLALDDVSSRFEEMAVLSDRVEELRQSLNELKTSHEQALAALSEVMQPHRGTLGSYEKPPPK